MVDELNIPDLSLPGALDQWTQETDQQLAESEESEAPEGEEKGKSNVAFARLRSRLGKSNKILQTIVDQAKKQVASQSQSQSQSRETASAGLGQNPHKERLEKVRARATQELGHIPDPNNQGDMETMSLLMTEAIVEERATEIVNKRMGPLQTMSLTNVLGRDKDLNAEDVKVIRQELDQLPPEIQGDPKVIQQIALAYKGLNIDKILARRSDGKKKPDKGPAKEEEIEDVDGIFGSRGSDTFAAEKPVFSPPDQAGASAASGRKAGTGVGLGEAALEEAEGGKTPPKLSEEDRALMRKMKIDPSNPGHVEDFLVAKRKKPEKTGLG